MVTFEELAEYLNDEYPYTEDVFGLVLDLVNGVTDIESLKTELSERKEHNA